MTIEPAVRERMLPKLAALMMAACDPVELINRTEQSPLKWNLDKFSVLMCRQASMWVLSLRPLQRGDETSGRRGARG